MDRKTRQRDVLMQLFKESKVPISPKEAYARARQKLPKIGLATIYRFVQEFVEEGFLITADLPGRAKKYEVADREHHHFFECEKCHKLYPIHQCPGSLEGLLPKGFQLKSHEIMLYGICSRCR